MPDIEKYIDQIKMKTLYEAREPGSLAKDILSEWETNKRLSPKMARLVLSAEKVCSTFKGHYKTHLGDILKNVVTTYRSVDGWSVLKAIEAEGMTAAKEQKKDGLLDKLGGG